MEYDPEGNLVWMFELLPELKKQFEVEPNYSIPVMNRLGHLNGIAVNEKDNVVYASFKNFSSVIKIDKATNRMLYLFGNKNITFGDSMQASGLFTQQHCPILLKNGNLMVFDNNLMKKGSGLVELNTGKPASEAPEKVWDFRFKEAALEKPFGPLMGSVQELPAETSRVIMVKENHVFFTNRKKEISWHISTYVNNGTQWLPVENYRASWASSLYPHYFTLQITGASDTLSKAGSLQKELAFTINNEGTENDVFDIEMLQPGTTFSLERKGVEVIKGQSLRVSFTSAMIRDLKENTELLVTVRSLPGQNARQLRYFIVK
jgi:hypothetical protein